MPVLEYQGRKRDPRLTRSLKDTVLLVAVTAVGGGAGSFLCALAAALLGWALPFVLVGGPAAALLVKVVDEHPMSDSVLVPLLLVAETVQYAGYALLFVLPVSRKNWLLAAVVALHAACCVYVASHLTYLR